MVFIMGGECPQILLAVPSIVYLCVRTKPKFDWLYRLFVCVCVCYFCVCVITCFNQSPKVTV